MRVIVNGEPRELAGRPTVADLLPDGSRGVAVAVNGTVVPRAEHAGTRLGDGDAVEIVTAVQGG
jgi:sulfur carrier protein